MPLQKTSYNIHYAISLNILFKNNVHFLREETTKAEATVHLTFYNTDGISRTMLKNLKITKQCVVLA